MSDRRHRKQPPTLPEGYRYGDARPAHSPGRLDPVSLTYPCSCGGRWFLGEREPYHVDAPAGLLFSEETRAVTNGWRAMHENAAAQLNRRQQEGGDAVAKHFGDAANAQMFRLSCPDLEERTGEETV